MRSKLEEQVAGTLDDYQISYEYESLKLPYVQPEVGRVYIPDFILKNGILLEVKGKLDVDARRKMKWVREHNPEEDIRFVFHRNNKLTRAKKSWRYSDWCRNNDYLCCFVAPGRTVPEQEKGWDEIVWDWSNE